MLATSLQALFQGKRDLFDGLWIAEHGEWSWEEHPVLLLDFTTIANHTAETFEIALDEYLERSARTAGIQLQSRLLMSKFTELISTLSEQSSKAVVVLIDEYDKPIIDHLGKGKDALEIAKTNRTILKGFFGVLKSITLSRALAFVFLTGISRFSKISIFSELNNLEDILRDEYAGLLGYTQEELERYFAGYIDRFAKHLNWKRERMLTRLAEQYDGYRFSENTQKVYNPYFNLKSVRSETI